MKGCIALRKGQDSLLPPCLPGKAAMPVTSGLTTHWLAVLPPGCLVLVLPWCHPRVGTNGLPPAWEVEPCKTVTWAV